MNIDPANFRGLKSGRWVSTQNSPFSTYNLLEGICWCLPGCEWEVLRPWRLIETLLVALANVRSSRRRRHHFRSFVKAPRGRCVKAPLWFTPNLNTLRDLKDLEHAFKGMFHRNQIGWRVIIWPDVDAVLKRSAVLRMHFNLIIHCSRERIPAALEWKCNATVGYTATHQVTLHDHLTRATLLQENPCLFSGWTSKQTKWAFMVACEHAWTFL